MVVKVPNSRTRAIGEGVYKVPAKTWTQIPGIPIEVYCLMASSVLDNDGELVLSGSGWWTVRAVTPDPS
jgi:hypothetical protein